VIDRNVLFIFAVVMFQLALAAIAFYSYRRRRRAGARDWDSLFRRLAFVDRASLAEVALDVIDESGRKRSDEESAILEPSEIWALIGGLEGLKVMEANCAVLIDLAAYVQQRYPEALVVAEQLRLSAREIEWNLKRLEGAAQTGKLESAFTMYAQPAAAAYYLMTREILALYERGHLPMLADLQKAL
jgi:hypothetical protein